MWRSAAVVLGLAVVVGGCQHGSGGGSSADTRIGVVGPASQTARVVLFKACLNRHGATVTQQSLAKLKVAFQDGLSTVFDVPKPGHDSLQFLQWQGPTGDLRMLMHCVGRTL